MPGNAFPGIWIMRKRNKEGFQEPNRKIWFIAIIVLVIIAIISYLSLILHL